MSKVIEVSDTNFEQEVTDSSTLTLVDFWAPWCGPCRKQLPVIEDIANDYLDKVKITKINIDDNQEKAFQLGISSIPTLLLFKEGQLVERLSGLHQKTELKSVIEKYL